jgi:hypothetical protein
METQVVSSIPCRARELLETIVAFCLNCVPNHHFRELIPNSRSQLPLVTSQDGTFFIINLISIIIYVYWNWL